MPNYAMTTKNLVVIINQNNETMEQYDVTLYDIFWGRNEQQNFMRLSMNSMKLVIPLHSLYWSIHTKDESKRGTAFAFIFGVN